MYELIITELAYKDLDDIISYISIDLVNPDAASDFLDEVEHCFSILKSTPKIYEYCHDSRLEKLKYRRVPIKNYLLIYKIDVKTHTVIILRVFYGAMNYMSLI